MASVNPYGIKVVQSGTTGVFINKRCLMKKMMVMHSAGGDAILKFYDLTSTPGESDPYYEFNAYGKGVFQVDMPDAGVFFSNGVYVGVPADATVTLWYEEV